MLAGRESLIRLIGKRRTFLPHRHRLLSSPSHSSLNLPNHQNRDAETAINTQAQSDYGKVDDTGDREGTGNEGICVEEQSATDKYVTCPVCGNQVGGEDYTINSHLDACLARGTKRRLTQRTLLQFNFRSNNKIRDHDKNSTRTNVFQPCPIYEIVENDVPQTKENNSDGIIGYGCSLCNMSRPCDGNLCSPAIHFEEIRQNHMDDVAEKNIIVDQMNDMVGASPLFSKSEMPPSDMAKFMDELPKRVLETYIVGRRFGDDVEIISGTSISLERDPFNKKDQNAIKVVCTDSDCCKVLGYLPRDLAYHLSPLIDKYQLMFKGVVASVPKNSLDVVPINIRCLEAPSDMETSNQNLHLFKSLWENVLYSIDCGKKSPPSAAKYQQNFRLIIEEVLRGNAHLFIDDEKLFLDSFNHLSDDSQRLFVRLYCRKGPWFRISNLSYPEILDYQEAVSALLGAGYISSFSSEKEINGYDMTEVLNVLTVAELSEILRMTKDCKVGMRKQDLVESLLSAFNDGSCPRLPTLILDRTGLTVRISSIAESLMWRVQRLFFLNGEQDLSAFLLVDLGIVKYPDYKCTISDQVFSRRSDFLAYEEAIELAQIMDQALDEHNHELVLQCIEISESRLLSSSTEGHQPVKVATFLRCFSASWVYSKAVSLGVSYFEREHRYKDAIKLLKLLLSNITEDGRRGYWTLRLSIDLEHIGCLDESLSVAEDGLQDPWVRAGLRMALQRRVVRLGKPPRRWKSPSFSQSVKRRISEVHIEGRPISSKIGMKSRFYGEDGEQCGVEELALQYYAGEGGGGWQGVHTESGIWLTIFGLLMWDIIFADVPNVFRSQFQTAPLDLETDRFYTTRKTLIESHLQNIHNGMAETLLIISCETHQGTSCRGVSWEKHSLSELRAAVTCIGGPCLALMCRLLARDYRSWSRGMPDLLMWRFQGEYEGEAKLVEVKGPRDRLSEQQRAWLLTLLDCGFDVEVCKVNPPLLSK